jgi:hypothetical protein
MMRDDRQNGQAVGAAGGSTSRAGAFPQLLIPSANMMGGPTPVSLDDAAEDTAIGRVTADGELTCGPVGAHPSVKGGHYSNAGGLSSR